MDGWRCGIVGRSLPELRGEEAEEGVVDGDGLQAGIAEGGGMAGKAGGAKVRKQAEGEIKEPDDEACGQGEDAVWDAEVGIEPEGLRLQEGREACDEVVDLGLGEAVDDEEGDDEVGRAGWGKEAEVGLSGGEAACVGRGVPTELGEHGWAEIDGVGLERRILAQERSGKAAVAVAEEERVAAVGEGGQVVGAGALEDGSECEVFEPAVGASQPVEVWGVHRVNGRRRTGVRRARSAAARRRVGCRVRVRFRQKRAEAANAVARGICG